MGWKTERQTDAPGRVAQPLIREAPGVLREATAPATGAARNAVRDAALAGVVAGFLALSGAFGSGAAPFGARLLYWSLALAGGTLIGIGISRLFARWSWSAAHPVWTGLLRVAAISAPTTLLVWGLTGLMFGGGRLAWGSLPEFLLPVVMVTAVMVSLGLLVSRSLVATHAAPLVAGAVSPGPPVRARLLDRLPPHLRGAALLAVQAEDHYLRLHTARGSDLILLRLGDALVELDGIEGAQVHRSWWVARDAVEGSSRAEGRVSLRLRGGLIAPVSRTYVAALRQAGWL